MGRNRSRTTTRRDGRSYELQANDVDPVPVTPRNPGGRPVFVGESDDDVLILDDVACPVPGNGSRRGGDTDDGNGTERDHALHTRGVLAVYTTLKVAHVVMIVLLVGVMGPALLFLDEMAAVQRDRTVVYNVVEHRMVQAQAAFAAESVDIERWANTSVQVGQQWLEATYANDVLGHWADVFAANFSRFRETWCSGTKEDVYGNMRFHGSPSQTPQELDYCWPLTDAQFQAMLVTPPLVDEAATVSGLFVKLNETSRARYAYDVNYLRRFGVRVNSTVEAPLLELDAVSPRLTTSLSSSKPKLMYVIGVLKVFRDALQVVPGFPFSELVRDLLTVSANLETSIQAGSVIGGISSPLRTKLQKLIARMLDEYDPPQVVSDEEVAYIRSLVDVGAPTVVAFSANATDAQVAAYDFEVHLSPLEALAITAFSLLLFADLLIQAYRIAVEVGRMRGRQLSKAFTVDMRSSVYAFCCRGGAWVAKAGRIASVVSTVLTGLVIAAAVVLLYYFVVVVPARYTARNGNGMISVTEQASLYSQRVRYDAVQATYMANFTNARNTNLTALASLRKRYELSVEPIEEWFHRVPEVMVQYVSLWRVDSVSGWSLPNNDPAWTRKIVSFLELQNGTDVAFAYRHDGSTNGHVPFTPSAFGLPLSLFDRLGAVLTVDTERVEFDPGMDFEQQRRQAIASRGDLAIYHLVTYGLLETLAIVWASWILLPALSEYIIDTYVYQAARAAGVPHQVAVELDVVDGGELPTALQSARRAETHAKLQSKVRPCLAYPFRMVVAGLGVALYIAVMLSASLALERNWFAV